MKKAAAASLLALSALMISPSIVRHAGSAYAQSGVQMDPAEFADYEAATKQATPQAQAPALEAYLVKYPKSAVKGDVVVRIMIAYSQFDHAKAVTAADSVLQLSPNNLQAYLFEVAFRTEAAQAQTDPAAKQAGLDSAATFAQQGLGVKTKADGVTDKDFAAQQAYATPYFYGAIAAAALNKSDMPTAISAYKSELAAMAPAAITTPAALQEDYFLGTAYYKSTPPDYINCTFYTTRAAALAPDQYKPQLQPLATFCYRKYHGGTDGYDAVVAAAKANPNPPDGFTITPAPSQGDILHKFVEDNATGLAELAISDKERVLQDGRPADADRVFDTVKGKTVEIPNGVVIKATADQVQVAVSDDAVQSKTADFAFNMKEPLKTLPTVGAKVTLTGTYASYTQSPLLIVMSDSEEVKGAAKKPVAKAPVRRGH